MSSCIHDLVLGSLTVPNCEAVSFQPGLEVTPGRNSGAIDPFAHFITSGMPKFTGTTMAIGTLMGSGGVLPAAGLYIASGNIDMPLSRRAIGSTREGSSSHTRMRGSKGMAIPTRISASQGSPFATADFEVNLLSSDGLTIPVAITNDQTLSSQTPATHYRLGPVYITKDGGSSVLLLGVVGFTVNPGIVLELEKFDGAIYPINAYIKQRDPSIDVQFIDEEHMDTFIDLFNGIDACTAYLRKMVEGSTVVSAATAEHIGFTFAEGIVTHEGVSGSGTETALPTLRLTGESLTVSVATAIPSA